MRLPGASRLNMQIVASALEAMEAFSPMKAVSLRLWRAAICEPCMSDTAVT